ncbi:MAG TPA: hypothetical protein VF881_09475 [Polyangiaceae bacterium]
MSDGSPFLPSDMRRFIEADRRVADPPDALRMDVAQHLDHKLGLGGAMTTPSAENNVGQWDFVPKSGPSLHPSTIYGWKLVLGALLAVGAGGLALSLALRSSHPTPPTKAATAAITARPAVTAPAAATSPERAAGMPVHLSGADDVPPTEDADVLPQDRVKRGTRVPAAMRAGATADLKGERTVLDAARAALVRRDTVAALAALRTHERSFPRGQLVEERESMRVQALVLAKDEDAARAAGQRFRRRFAHSVFLPVVEKALERLP